MVGDCSGPFHPNSDLFSRRCRVARQPVRENPTRFESKRAAVALDPRLGRVSVPVDRRDVSGRRRDDWSPSRSANQFPLDRDRITEEVEYRAVGVNRCG